MGLGVGQSERALGSLVREARNKLAPSPPKGEGGSRETCRYRRTRFALGRPVAPARPLSRARIPPLRARPVKVLWHATRRWRTPPPPPPTYTPHTHARALSPSPRPPRAVHPALALGGRHQNASAAPAPTAAGARRRRAQFRARARPRARIERRNKRARVAALRGTASAPEPRLLHRVQRRAGDLQLAGWLAPARRVRAARARLLRAGWWRRERVARAHARRREPARSTRPRGPPRGMMMDPAGRPTHHHEDHLHPLHLHCPSHSSWGLQLGRRPAPRPATSLLEATGDT